ncbi:MAG: tRNA pseudouridine(38-40) synthase TruA [Ignavibacteria bacterium]|nr:tRNA pseudouridine(38-40) synthase TruA [Ignavibacteria bacterium]
MRFKYTLEYDGTKYSGWQIQKNTRTVQGTLVKCIKSMLDETKGKSGYGDFYGSGRTDKGVHALAQTAHLECETMLAPHIQKMKMNDILPSDINILNVERVANNFHARHSAVARQYLYVISKRRTAFEKKYVWWIKDTLDVTAMKTLAELLKGFRDFRSFSEPDPNNKSTLVDLDFIELTDTEDKIYVRIKASHFLWKMVRRIVGTLVEAGRGNIGAKDIQKYLKSYSKDPAIFTAPPSGLFLEKIFY